LALLPQRSRAAVIEFPAVEEVLDEAA